MNVQEQINTYIDELETLKKNLHQNYKCKEFKIFVDALTKVTNDSNNHNFDKAIEAGNNYIKSLNNNCEPEKTTQQEKKKQQQTQTQQRQRTHQIKHSDNNKFTYLNVNFIKQETDSNTNQKNCNVILKKDKNTYKITQVENCSNHKVYTYLEENGKKYLCKVIINNRQTLNYLNKNNEKYTQYFNKIKEWCNKQNKKGGYSPFFTDTPSSSSALSSNDIQRNIMSLFGH